MHRQDYSLDVKKLDAPRVLGYASTGIRSVQARSEPATGVRRSHGAWAETGPMRRRGNVRNRISSDSMPP